MASKPGREQFLNWTANRGRNQQDTPSQVPDDQCTLAFNVVLQEKGLATKRVGSSAVVTTRAGGLLANAFAGVSQFFWTQFANLGSLLGGASPVLWLLDRSATPKLIHVDDANVSTFIDLAAGGLGNDVQTRPQDSTGVQLNNILYLSYNSAVNRLHMVFGGPLRVGIIAPAAAMVGNIGAGAYPATLRFYRVQFILQDGSGVNLTRSNLGAPVSFTPSGAGTAARVTRPAQPDGPGAWIVWGSPDGVNYFNISGVIASGTTIYDDSANPLLYNTGDNAAPLEGTYSLWPSVRFLLSTGTRLMGFGVFEAATGDAVPTAPGRVYFSPVIGTTDDAHDEMRIVNTIEQKGWIDVSLAEGLEDRALVGPLDDNYFAFLSQGVAMLVPTGDAFAPFERRFIDKNKGAMNQWSTFLGEDEAGNPCIYFLDPTRGPYRYGTMGFQWLGYDVQNTWATVNHSAAHRICHGLWFPQKRQAWFYLATGTFNADDPNTILVFHANLGRPHGASEVRGGWVDFPSSNLATARCSILRGYLGFPHGGFAGAADSSVGIVLSHDAAVVTDRGVAHTGTVAKGFSVAPISVDKQLGDAYVQATALTGGVIQQLIVTNYSAALSTSQVSLTPSGTETRVLRRFQDAAMSEAFEFAVVLSDSGAASVGIWSIDLWTASIERTNER